MYTGRKFRIRAIGNHPALAEGIIGERLGSQEGLEYYNATVTIRFHENATHHVTAQVAIRDLGELEEFFMKVEGADRMGDYTTQLQWI